jgi:hypothetical protein
VRRAPEARERSFSKVTVASLPTTVVNGAAASGAKPLIDSALRLLSTGMNRIV